MEECFFCRYCNIEQFWEEKLHNTFDGAGVHLEKRYVYQLGIYLDEGNGSVALLWHIAKVLALLKVMCEIN